VTIFYEDPPGKYKRLGPGREVRLRNAYVIKYESMVKDGAGEVVELHCTYDPETRNASPPDGRKVKGVIHWVSAENCVPAEVRLYDRLFQVPNPAGESEEFTEYLNPNSLETLTSCYVESGLKDAEPGSRYQFERIGYFCVDSGDSLPGSPVFNRVVPLRDTWGKIAGKGK